MKNPETFEVIEIWIVTDGNRDRYLSLSPTAARLYAETVNRYLTPADKACHVEQRTALLQPLRAATGTRPL